MWLGLRIMLLWVSASAFGFAQMAVLSGTITNAKGPLIRVIVRARETNSGKAYEASSNAKGNYSLQLPAGTYDLFATVVGHGAFSQRAIALKPGEKRTVNAELVPSLNEGTPGELTFLHLGDE